MKVKIGAIINSIPAFDALLTAQKPADLHFDLIVITQALQPQINAWRETAKAIQERHKSPKEGSAKFAAMEKELNEAFNREVEVAVEKIPAKRFGKTELNGAALLALGWLIDTKR